MPEAAFHIFHLYKIFLSSKPSYAAAPWKRLFSNTYLYTYPAKDNVRTPKEVDNHTNLNSLPVCCKQEKAAFSFFATGFVWDRVNFLRSGYMELSFGFVLV